MKTLRTYGLLLAIVLAFTAPCPADEPDRAAVVWPQIFAGDSVNTSLFAKSFLDAVPANTLNAIVADLKKNLGTFVSSSGLASDAVLTFSGGSVRAQIALDPSGKISGLLFTSMVAQAATKILTDLLTSGIARDDGFVQGVPKDFGSQLTALMSQMRAQSGDFVKLEPLLGVYRTTFARGTYITAIAVDGSGKIAMIRFVPEAPPKKSALDDALQRLGQLSGKVSYVFLEGRTERAALNADTPLSIGSAFKLSVLATLRREIAAGRRHWSDVVILHDADKSLPSGRLQDWPSGTHLTLETLATLMISISDNTATDALIHALQREAIEPAAFGNTPLLTTRNMFALKSKGAAVLRETWRKGSTAQRRALLTKLDALAIPDILQADIQPADLDIEWHYSTRNLCMLMAQVADLPLMTINPGVALPTDWKRVAYKGGSDAGVINMTTMLTSLKGTHFCLSATLNNSEQQIDASAFATTYSGVLDAIRESSAGNPGAAH